MTKVLDLNGKIFDHLTVIERRKENTKAGKAVWICQCICGNLCEKISSKLKNCKYKKSCGCKAYENVITHGKTKSPEYKTWQSIKDRCYGKETDKNIKYKEKQITMCEKWLNNFDNFYKDMGDCNGLTIDRIDNNKGYFKENCRWATKKEQIKNRDCTLYYEFNGITKTLKEWCIEYNINYNHAHKNLKYRNWTIEEVLNK